MSFLVACIHSFEIRVIKFLLSLADNKHTVKVPSTPVSFPLLYLPFLSSNISEKLMLSTYVTRWMMDILIVVTNSFLVRYYYYVLCQDSSILHICAFQHEECELLKFYLIFKVRLKLVIIPAVQPKRDGEKREKTERKYNGTR